MTSPDDTVHLLHVGEPVLYAPDGTELEPSEQVAYDLVHPDECEHVTGFHGEEVYDCAIGLLVDGGGLLLALGVETWTGHEHLAPGQYRVQAWSQRYDVPGEPTDYDAGIDILDDLPTPVAQ